jgi:hypothetical protein
MATTNRGRRATARLGVAGTALATFAATALATATALAAVAVGPAAPAQAAGGSPVRAEQASQHNQSPTKSATVGCPAADQSVYAAGARIVDADGGVVLTGVTPDPALGSVTATATARTGYPSAWSVVVYAVCDASSPPPFRVAATVTGSTTATATCPGQHHLTGTGFRFTGLVDHSYPDEVSIGPGLHSVRVHTGGPGTPAQVTAFAICKRPTQPTGPPAVWVTASSGVDATWPKQVAAGDPSSTRRIYGVGGMVQGGGGQVFLSALVPDLDQDLARVEAVRALPLPGSPSQPDGARFAAAEDDSEAEGSVTAFGILIGTFH